MDAQSYKADIGRKSSAGCPGRTQLTKSEFNLFKRTDTQQWEHNRCTRCVIISKCAIFCRVVWFSGVTSVPKHLIQSGANTRVDFHVEYSEHASLTVLVLTKLTESCCSTAQLRHRCSPSWENLLFVLTMEASPVLRPTRGGFGSCCAAPASEVLFLLWF